MAEYSEEEHDIDIESDDDDEGLSTGSLIFPTEAEKKAHHNALERKRRDQIKESFNRLRDVISQGRDEKMSRAQILQRATKYIHLMSGRNHSGQKELDVLRRKIHILRQQDQLSASSTEETPTTDNTKQQQNESCDFSDNSEDNNLDNTSFYNKNNNLIINNNNNNNRNHGRHISRGDGVMSNSGRINHRGSNSFGMNDDDLSDDDDDVDGRRGRGVIGGGKNKRPKLKEMI